MGRSDDAAAAAASGRTPAVLQAEENLTQYALKYAGLDAYGREAVEATTRAEYSRRRCESAPATPAAYFGNIPVPGENAKE